MKIDWFKKLKAKYRCYKRKHHNFVFVPMSMDSVFEIDVLRCACGATQERRWKTQTLEAEQLCDNCNVPRTYKRMVLTEKTLIKKHAKETKFIPVPTILGKIWLGAIFKKIHYDVVN